MVTDDGKTIQDVLDRLQQQIDELPPELIKRRIFMAAYRRATQDVAESIDDARFEDLRWVELWTVRFADVFLAAHDADRMGRSVDVPRPWRLVFAAPNDLPPAQQLALGLTAHLNYDLPVTLQAIVTKEEFSQPDKLASRRRDFGRVDALLTSRMAAELTGFGPGTMRNWAVSSVHRLAGQRWFRAVGNSVWHNTEQLQLAKSQGEDSYQQRLAELSVISAAKVAELLAAPQTAMRMVASDFAVRLPPPAIPERLTSIPERSAGEQLPRQRGP
ncbi:MAG: DUF5995 family protein, partial [Nakamurella sp.]